MRTWSGRTCSAAQICAAFGEFDTNKSGTISREEFRAVLTRATTAGPGLSVAESDEIFNDHDKNRDGVLDTSQFAAALASGVTAPPPSVPAAKTRTLLEALLPKSNDGAAPADRRKGARGHWAKARAMGLTSRAFVNAGLTYESREDSAVVRLRRASATSRFSVQGTRNDMARYTEPHAIWEALRTGAVRLVRASWLVEEHKAGRVLGRRQELPEEAFIDIQELQCLWDAAIGGEGYPDIYEKPTQENADNLMPILAISFCWLSPRHPDPEGKQLAIVAAALERELPKYAKYGFAEMGVFWDWCSLYQKNPALYEDRAAYDTSRTADEAAAFGCALESTMDLWYAHQGTMVYLLSELPAGSTRSHGYEASGWTMYCRRSCCPYASVARAHRALLSAGTSVARQSKSSPTS